MSRHCRLKGPRGPDLFVACRCRPPMERGNKEQRRCRTKPYPTAKALAQRKTLHQLGPEDRAGGPFLACKLSRRFGQGQALCGRWIFPLHDLAGRLARACGLDYGFIDAGDGPAIFIIMIAERHRFRASALDSWRSNIQRPVLALHCRLCGCALPLTLAVERCGPAGARLIDESRLLLIALLQFHHKREGKADLWLIRRRAPEYERPV